MKTSFSLLAVLAIQISAVQAAVIWNDNFTEPSLNPNFSVNRNYGSVNAGQTGGRLVLSSNQAADFAFVNVATATDQLGNGQFGGSPVFNFFDHTVSMKISDPVFNGGLTAGVGYNLFLLVGVPFEGDPLNLTPRTAFSGAFARINYDVGGVWSITVGDRIIGGSAATSTLAVSGAPSAIEFTLQGNQWSLGLAGATFTESGNVLASGTLSQLSASDLSGTPYFSIGTINNGDLASGSVPFDISIDQLQISDTASIPEPNSLALAGAGLLMAGWWFRKTRQSQTA